MSRQVLNSLSTEEEIQTVLEYAISTLQSVRHRDQQTDIVLHQILRREACYIAWELLDEIVDAPNKNLTTYDG